MVACYKSPAGERLREISVAHYVVRQREKIFEERPVLLRVQNHWNIPSKETNTKEKKQNN